MEFGSVFLFLDSCRCDFHGKVCDPPAFIYMGADKYENEELIKYGLPEDIWYVIINVKVSEIGLVSHDGPLYPKGFTLISFQVPTFIFGSQKVQIGRISPKR